MSKKKLFIFSSLFLIIVLITTYIVFSNIKINFLFETLSSIKVEYIVLSIILSIFYFIFQGLYMKIVLKTMNEDITLNKGIYYSIVEFFFSAITPSATGGQPVQLYYMSKDKIPTDKSLITLITNTMIFKLYLLILGLIILVFRSDLVFNNGVFTAICFMTGYVFDVFLIIVGYLLIFNSKVIRKCLNVIYNIKNSLSKEKQDYTNKIDDLINQYSNNADYIKKHKKDIIKVTIITFIQRTFMFSITYVVYRALGFYGISFIELLLLQVFTQIAIEALPLPGGTGAIEAIISNIYFYIFGDVTLIGMLLVRTLSFYIPIIVIMIIIIVVTRRYYFEK